jgi:hypothetical protein
MNPTSKEAVLERERRLSVPAGMTALLGVLVFLASIFVQQSAGSSGGTDAEQLAHFHQHSGSFITASVLQAIALLMFIFPLYFLFTAAAARAPQVRRWIVVLIFAGPILLAARGVVVSNGLKDTADKFVAQKAAVEREAEAKFRQQQGTRGGGAAKAPASGAAPQTNPTTTAATTTATTSTGTTSTTTTTTATATTAAQAATNASDDLASNLIDDSSTLKAGNGIALPGILSLVAAMIYTPLWAMRTGLLTRFWATLGMALGASLILLPFGIVGLALWFAALGLILVDRWPGGRPPAWDAGVAVPWPRPGQPPPDDATLEGSGREISERPLPEGEPTGGGEPVGWGKPEPRPTPSPEPPPVSPGGPTREERRKKRKRRG